MKHFVFAMGPACYLELTAEKVRVSDSAFEAYVGNELVASFERRAVGGFFEKERAIKPNPQDPPADGTTQFLQ